MMREDFAANIATHRLLYQMCEIYVCCKMGFLSKGFAAIIAHVRLVIGMNCSMTYKIGMVSEGCFTDGTSERFVPGVYINMLLQTKFRRKCLAALLAFVLFIAIVPEHVQVEIPLCGK